MEPHAESISVPAEKVADLSESASPPTTSSSSSRTIDVNLQSAYEQEMASKDVDARIAELDEAEAAAKKV